MHSLCDCSPLLHRHGTAHTKPSLPRGSDPPSTMCKTSGRLLALILQGTLHISHLDLHNQDRIQCTHHQYCLAQTHSHIVYIHPPHQRSLHHMPRTSCDLTRVLRPDPLHMSHIPLRLDSLSLHRMDYKRYGHCLAVNRRGTESTAHPRHRYRCRTRHTP